MTSPTGTKPLDVLLASKGHAFQREPFFQMFDSFGAEGIQYTHVEQPAAQRFFSPELAAPYDVIVDYSMPGIRRGVPSDPPEWFKRDYVRLLEAGSHGFVMIHHNLCSWPSWPTYAEIVGGRFLYEPGELRGQEWPDSGYLLGVEHHMHIVKPEHPVVAGVEDGFAMQDELYLSPVFEDDLDVLMRSDFEFIEKNFFSPSLAIRGRMYERGDWHHPPTSNAVVWAKNYRNSPIVYIEPGDVPTSYNNPNYRRLLRNAIDWVASSEAKAWARERAAAKAKVEPPAFPQPGLNRVPAHWEPRVDPKRPEKTCLFCEKDGVERYGSSGVCDPHTVTKGDREVTGPLCGNCHIALLDDTVDTGGWAVMR